MPVTLTIALLLAACGGGTVPSTAPTPAEPAATSSSGEATPSVTGSTPAATDIGGVEPTAIPATAIPAELSFNVEAGSVGEAMVTFAAGGTVMASAADGTTFELVVPARALVEDTVIRMTPLTGVDGFGDGAVHAVRLEPEGLEFFAVARLAITPSTPIPIVDQVMFQATGTGKEVSAALVDVGSEPIVILVQHFSLAGVGLARGQAVWLEAQARKALKRIGHVVGMHLQAERKRQLAGRAAQPEVMDEVSRLFDDADRDVLGQLREAALLSCSATTVYIGALRNLEYQRSLIGLQNDDTGAATVAESARALEASFGICEREAIEQCKAKPDPQILIGFWIGWERQQEFLEITANVLGDDFDDRAKRICDAKAFAFEFAAVQLPNNLTGTTFDVTGTVQGCPDGSGGWVFSGDYVVDVGGSFSTEWQGYLLDMVGHQDVSQFNVVLGFFESVDLQNSLPETARDGAGVLQVTDATGDTPAMALTVWNALDEILGTFTPTFAAVEPHCST